MAKLKLTKIEIEIKGGRKLEFSLEEAKELYDKLPELFDLLEFVEREGDQAIIPKIDIKIKGKMAKASLEEAQEIFYQLRELFNLLELARF